MLFNIRKDVLSMLLGSLLVIMFSYLAISSITSLLLPKPIYLVGGSWVIGKQNIIMTVLCFYIFFEVTHRFFFQSLNFYLATFIVVLNILYISFFFKNGVLLYGRSFMVVTVLLSIIYSMVLLSGRGNLLRERNGVLFTFIGLTWCFFPSIGEMP